MIAWKIQFKGDKSMTNKVESTIISKEING